MISRRRLVRDAALGTTALQLGRLAALAEAAEATGLAAAFENDFKIGVAVSDRTISEKVAADWALIEREFNALTPENAMKWARIRPDGKNWSWDDADELVARGSANGMYISGHTLVWHSQVPRNVFSADDGEPLTRAGLIGVLEEHIATLVGRYRGRIQSWDVANESIEEDNGWRRSNPWYRIIGDDFMELAFRMAHETDPDAKLLYNDYNMHNPGKRRFLEALLRDYIARGVPIHGVGFQTHVGLDYPDLGEWEKSLAAYAALGLEIHISELDVDVLPSPTPATADVANRAQYASEIDPYRDGLSEEAKDRLAARYVQLFELFLKYRASIARVTFWGLYDGISWKNNFPVFGRVNYPLLFDRQREPKEAYRRVLSLVG